MVEHFRTLQQLVASREITLGRGEVISNLDIERIPGTYPVYSSSAQGTGEFGRYGRFMFDEELITWSIDGGGRPFYRPRHKFSITNVCGFLKILSSDKWDYRYMQAAMELQHARISFDYQTKAHPSVIQHLYRFADIPLAEQSRIAAVLDTVNEAIAKTEAVIAKLKQVRAGLLHDLLTRGLDEHGQLRDPIAHPEKFKDSPVGRIPKEGTCSRFDKVLDGIDAGKSPDYPDQPAAPGDWGVLKVSAIWPEGFRPYENKRVTKAMHQVATYEIRNGDLLISRSNTYELVGLVCLVRNAPPRLMLCDKTLRLRLKAELGINPFFELLLQTRTVRNQIEINATGTSGSMKNISQEVIRALCLAYPKVEEQRRILTAVSPVNYELEALRREFNKLVQLKSGLMADLLTGCVRVPESISVVENQS